MVIVAISAVCVTVNMRTFAKGQLAVGQFSAVESEVQQLRNINESLRNEVERLKNDPKTIELAARSRLNMIRGNEYVVPTVESR
jgi:cell division protein FtsB